MGKSYFRSSVALRLASLFSSDHIIFQSQGLFGMVPAMYVNLAPDRQSCIWTPSMWLTLSHVVSMEVIGDGKHDGIHIAPDHNTFDADE